MNQQIINATTVTWGAAAAAGTVGTSVIDIPAADGTAGKEDKPLLIIVRNMSTSAVSVRARVTVTWTDGVTTRYALLADPLIPAGAAGSGDDGGTAFIVEKANLSGGCRLSFVNDATAPGGGQSISVEVWQ